MKIKDLKESKELDSKEMAGVAGGFGYGWPKVKGFELNIASPVNAPKQASLLGLAESFTGPQTNTNLQSDNDYNAVVGMGQVVNTGGNHNITTQDAYSNAANIITSAQ